MRFQRPGAGYDLANEAEFRRQLDQILAGLAPTTARYTPAMSSSGGGEALTYTSRNGLWIRLGGLVWFAAEVTLATKSGGSGDIQISLPTLSAAGPAQMVSVQVDSMGATWTGAPTALIASGAGVAQVREHSAGSAAQAWSKLGATGTVRVGGLYVPAS